MLLVLFTISSENFLGPAPVPKNYDVCTKDMCETTGQPCKDLGQATNPKGDKAYVYPSVDGKQPVCFNRNYMNSLDFTKLTEEKKRELSTGQISELARVERIRKERQEAEAAAEAASAPAPVAEEVSPAPEAVTEEVPPAQAEEPAPAAVSVAVTEEPAPSAVAVTESPTPEAVTEEVSPAPVAVTEPQVTPAVVQGPVSSETIPVAPFASTSNEPTPDPFQQVDTPSPLKAKAAAASTEAKPSASEIRGAKATKEEFEDARGALIESLSQDPPGKVKSKEDIGLKEKIDKINQQTELIDQKINEIKSELCSSGETYQFC